MMSYEGSILAQIMEIREREINNLFNSYLALEGQSPGVFTSRKEQHQRIEINCSVSISFGCGHLMKAVWRYRTCRMCGGWQSYMGVSSYEWCHYCNVFGERSFEELKQDISRYVRDSHCANFDQHSDSPVPTSYSINYNGKRYTRMREEDVIKDIWREEGLWSDAEEELYG